MSDATDLPDLAASIWYHRTYVRRCPLHAEHALDLEIQLLRLQYTVFQLHTLAPYPASIRTHSRHALMQVTGVSKR